MGKPVRRGGSASARASGRGRRAARGTPRGAARRAARPLRVKLGIDPTRPDIHLGHTVVLQKLREFQDLGPHGRPDHRRLHGAGRRPERPSRTRPVLTPEEIEANALTYQEQAFKVLDRERTEVRHNSEWLEMPSGGALRARPAVDRRAAARARRLHQADGGRRADLRCSSCSIRCSRATTRWRSRPTSSSAAPTRSSTCCSGATSRRRTASRRSRS